MKDNTETKKTPLLEEMEKLLRNVRRTFRQERVYRRMVSLVLGEIMTLGRHTLTQVLRTLGAIECDWTAFYRLFSKKRFDVEAVNRQLIKETLEHTEKGSTYTVTVDGVKIPRTGKHIGGASWWLAANTAPFKPGLQQGQRFVEVAWLTPAEDSYSKAIPLHWRPAVTEKANPSSATPEKEWEAGLENLKWVREELDQQGHEETRLVALMDGGYDTQGIWQDLPENTTALIRCARNRALYALPKLPKGKRKRGRPVLYGERQEAPYKWLKRRKSETKITIRIRRRVRKLRYWVSGPLLVEGAPDRPLFLLVVGGQSWKQGYKSRYRKPVFYLVNAVMVDGKWQLPFPVETLLIWAWQRWECEVAHREMKSALRIGDKQCWGENSALAAVQWGVWIYALMVLAAYRVWGITCGPRRQGRWYTGQRRWSFSTLRQAFQAELWDYADFHPLYSRSLDKWLKKDAWLSGLANAHADPAYI